MHARARSTARSRRLALAVACVVVAFFGNRAREADADAISGRSRAVRERTRRRRPAVRARHDASGVVVATSGQLRQLRGGGGSEQRMSRRLEAARGVAACQSRDVCGTRTVNGVQRRASACTSKCWTPTEEELHPIGETNDVGGRCFRRACGGDEKTDSYCKFQPQTRVDLRVIPSESLSDRRRYDIQMREYGGMPRQDQKLDVPDKYKYAACRRVGRKLHGVFVDDDIVP